MRKVIEFGKFEEWLPDLTGIKSKIPQWYRDQDMWNDKKPLDNSYDVSKSFKSCMPFLDAMTSGYTIELWTDIRVRQENGYPIITWASGPEPVGLRSTETNKSLPIPNGFNSSQFTWKFPYTIKVPLGYSCLVTHPLNRHDLPFFGLSAIVDNEVATLGPGNYPFFIKEGFEGIIPAGTPIMQIIPFKRENWQTKENKNLLKESINLQKKIFSVISGYYKKNIWKRKEYL
jgi:hypothetical protein